MSRIFRFARLPGVEIFPLHFAIVTFGQEVLLWLATRCSKA